jgi:hypothetical protein
MTDFNAERKTCADAKKTCDARKSCQEDKNACEAGVKGREMQEIAKGIQSVAAQIIAAQKMVLDSQCKKDTAWRSASSDKTCLDVNRMNNDPYARYWTDKDGKKAGDYCNVYCGLDARWVKETNNKPAGSDYYGVKSFGCELQSAPTGTSSQIDIQKKCDDDVKCVGYYSNEAKGPSVPWFMATDTSPVQCTKHGDDRNFPTFYRINRGTTTPAADAVVEKPSPGWVKESNSKPDGIELVKSHGCRISGDWSSTGDRAAIESACQNNPSCVGYYDNGVKSPDGDQWLVATDINPVDCKKPGDMHSYPHFYRFNRPAPPPSEAELKASRDAHWGTSKPNFDGLSFKLPDMNLDGDVFTKELYGDVKLGDNYGRACTGKTQLLVRDSLMTMESSDCVQACKLDEKCQFATFIKNDTTKNRRCVHSEGLINKGDCVADSLGKNLTLYSTFRKF